MYFDEGSFAGVFQFGGDAEEFSKFTYMAGWYIATGFAVDGVSFCYQALPAVLVARRCEMITALRLFRGYQCEFP
jgi:hypothetical protein